MPECVHGEGPKYLYVLPNIMEHILMLRALDRYVIHSGLKFKR